MNSDLTNPNSFLWAELGWTPSSEQIKKFEHLQALIIKWNKKINLTKLFKDDDYWINQVFDSLWPLKNELNRPDRLKNCIDIGSGCGFPGLAIAIALPKYNVTLVDSNIKKTTALESIVNELLLSSRVLIRNERIELTGQNPKLRGSFDLAIARAVAPTSVTAEYLIPLINKNGEAVLYKGRWSKVEEELLEKALKSLNGKIKYIEKTYLPIERGIRHQIRLGPQDICPKKYPRAIGRPLKRPLN